MVNHRLIPSFVAGRCGVLTQVIPKEVVIDPFDRFFASAGEACFAPWSGRPQGEHNDVQRAQKTGLRWANSVHLVRCGACPMHRIALRTGPARVNGFDSIKWVNNYFLWYNLQMAILEQIKAISRGEFALPRRQKHNILSFDDICAAACRWRLLFQGVHGLEGPFEYDTSCSANI